MLHHRKRKAWKRPFKSTRREGQESCNLWTGVVVDGSCNVKGSVPILQLTIRGQQTSLMGQIATAELKLVPLTRILYHERSRNFNIHDAENKKVIGAP